MYKTLLLGLSLCLVALAANAQLKTADDFFHNGAQYYIHGKKEESKNEIFTGLKFYPQDPKLNGLAVLLKQEEKEQQQNQQNQQSQQDQKQDQKPDQQQPQQNQQSQDQKPPDQSPQKPEGSKPEQKDQQPQQAGKPEDQKQPQPAQAGEHKEPSEEEKQEAAAAAAGEMSPKQAAQLLDTQKGQEKMMPAKPRKPAERAKPLKDW